MSFSVAILSAVPWSKILGSRINHCGGFYAGSVRREVSGNNADSKRASTPLLEKLIVPSWSLQRRLRKVTLPGSGLLEGPWASKDLLQYGQVSRPVSRPYISGRH